MIQLIVRNLKTKTEEVIVFSSKDKCEDFLEKCCANYEAKPDKGIQYRVSGATYDTKSEYAIIKPYLYKEDKDDSEN